MPAMHDELWGAAHGMDICMQRWPKYFTPHRTLIGTLPRRANNRGGTSHSDPITTIAQALRPNVLLRSPPMQMNTHGLRWTPALCALALDETYRA